MGFKTHKSSNIIKGHHFVLVYADVMLGPSVDTLGMP